MARNIRWRTHFKSLGNKDCWVYIYDEGWSGDITDLTPAANPFVFDEDDTDSLLETIRVKTAYLRVVELNYGDLTELYPQTNTSHFVNVTYNGTSVFKGFMQAQSFDVPYRPGPRLLEFPLMSPLGILSGCYFSAPSAPTYKTLSAVIKDVIDIMDADIAYVVFPDFMVSDSVRTLTLRMNTLTYCPFNPDYDRNPNSFVPLYKPNTLMSFIEALCSCFGLIVHDMPGMLVFARYDYTGIYSQYTASTMANTSPNIQDITTGAAVYDLSGLQSKSDKGTEKTILPISKLTINYDDDYFPSYEMPWDRSKASTSSSFWVVLVPSTDEITSSRLSTSAMPTTLSNTVVMCGIAGHEDLGGFKSMMMFSFDLNAGEGETIFTWKLYQVPKFSGYGCNLSFSVVEISTNTDLSDVFYETIPAKERRVGMTIKNGNYYYNGYSWVNQAALEVIYRNTDESGNIELQISQRIPDPSVPLEITFTKGNLQHTKIWGIRDVTISRTQLGIYTYTGIDLSNKLELINTNGSNSEASIAQTINVARRSEDALINDDGTMNSFTATLYHYMFATQHKITIDTFITPAVIYYLQKIIIGNSIKKRIVGIGFDLWNDIVTLTAQGSTILNT